MPKRIVHTMVIVIFAFFFLISSCFVFGEEKKPQPDDKQLIPKEKTFKEPVTGMEFVLAKGGCFQMGDTFGDGDGVFFFSDTHRAQMGSTFGDGSAEKPVHEVCVNDFYIGKYEVTQKQWQDVMGDNPSYFRNCGDCPVANISWNDTEEFINKLNQKNAGAGSPNAGTGLKPAPAFGAFRLPTEAEWEYAARSGGKNEKYAGGNDIDSIAWYSSNSGSKTHPVGQKQPNGLGIYDMSGNVWEWVQDWYDENYYKNSPKDNPKGANGSAYRILRGGSWFSIPLNLRTAKRSRLEPADRISDHGFRLAFPLK